MSAIGSTFPSHAVYFRLQNNEPLANRIYLTDMSRIYFQDLPRGAFNDTRDI